MFFMKKYKDHKLAVEKMEAARTVFSNCNNFSTSSPETLETMRLSFNQAASCLLDKPTLRAAFPEKDKYKSGGGEWAIPYLSAAGDSAVVTLAKTARSALMTEIRIEATKSLHEIHKAGKAYWSERTYYKASCEFGETIRKNVDSDNPDLQAVAASAFAYLADDNPDALVRYLDSHYHSWMLKATNNSNEQIRRAVTKCLINLYPSGGEKVMDTFRHNATLAMPIYPDSIEAYQMLQDKMIEQSKRALNLSPSSVHSKM